MTILKNLIILEAKAALGMMMFMIVGVIIIAIGDKELYQEMKKYFIIAWYVEVMPELVRWCYKNAR